MSARLTNLSTQQPITVTNYQIFKKIIAHAITETIIKYYGKIFFDTNIFWKKLLHDVKYKGKKIQDRYSYFLNTYLFFSIFLKEERDRELMTSLSSELKNLGPTP